MKNCLYFLLFIGLTLSCKKKEKEPEPEPEPAKKGNITINVLSYDSLGQLLSDHSGFRVRLSSSQTTTTTASGKVSFNEMPYETYVPEVFKEGWDGGPSMIILNAPTKEENIAVAKRSPFQLKNFSISVVNPDSITISFKLDRPVPLGKKCKVAVIISRQAGITGNAYDASGILETADTTVVNFNINKFINIKSLILGTDSAKTLYLNAIPVSYGEYENTLTPKPVMLGENLFAPAPLTITKNW